MKTNALIPTGGLLVAATFAAKVYAQGPLLPLPTQSPPQTTTAQTAATQTATAQTATTDTTIVSPPTAQELNEQISYWRKVAGLTLLRGPGVTMLVSDRKDGKGSSGPPGVVHDYDLLEIINALRAYGAEGIAINGVRVGSATAIRAVGPKISAGGQTLRHPYRIEAIGDAARMKKGLLAPKGWLDVNSKFGPRVAIARARALRLRPLTKVPQFRFGKPE